MIPALVYLCEGTMSSVLHDLKLALRAIKRRPGTSLAVIATLMVAIGATTAVYSFVHGVLLEPLAYPEPSRLVRIWETRPDWANSENETFRAFADRMPVQYPQVEKWARADTGFESLGAYVDVGFVDRTGGIARVVQGQEVSSGFFDVLKVEPILGRRLHASDDSPGAPPVAVLSEAFWKAHFHEDEAAIGSTLSLEGRPHEVIGVMPASFQTPTFEVAATPPRIWTQLTEESRVGDNSSQVIARLAPSASLTLASKRLAQVQTQLNTELPENRLRRGTRVVDLRESIVSDIRTTVWFLFGAVFLVLAIATINIANVLAVAGLARRQELAVRSALGAGRSRLVRGLLTEAMILTAASGALGILLAKGTLPLLLKLVPNSIPRHGEVSLTPEVLLIGLLITSATALLVGIYPALLATVTQPQSTLRLARQTSSRGEQRTRSLLIVGEVALAFVLLVGAGLLTNSYKNLWSVDRGFPTEGLVTLTIIPDSSVHTTRAQEDGFLRALRERLNTIAGVKASAANNIPLSGDQSGTSVSIQDPMGQRAELEGNVLLSVGFDNYFEVAGIQVLAGRGFNSNDRADTQPVAVINREMAQRFWPNQREHSILGRTLEIDGRQGIEIVGITSNVLHRALSSPIQPKVYLPATQSNRSVYEWVLRTTGPPSDAIAQARAAVASLSPTTPVGRVQVLDDTIKGAVAVPRLRSRLSVGLSALAIGLALIGIYGSLAFSVAQRGKEIAIRMALGSTRNEVIRGVLAGALKLTGAGLALGLVASISLTRIVSQFLFEIPALHIPTYLVMAACSVMVTCLAALLPARRASRVDPNEALRA